MIAAYSGYSDHEESVQLNLIGEMLGSPDVTTLNDLKGTIEKLAAKQEQSASVDWQRLKPFQIGDLGKQFSAIGQYPLTIVWGPDPSAYGIAADVGDACRLAQWSGCTPDKSPENVFPIDISVHWKAGYQPIAKAIADSLHDVIGMPASAVPVPEPNLTTPLEVTIGNRPV
jgi:hypothetical protein